MGLRNKLKYNQSLHAVKRKLTGKRKWQRLRDWLNKNPKGGIGIAVAVFVLSLTIAWFALSGGTRQGRHVDSEWYYDLAENQLFPAPINRFPPIEAPSGKKVDGRDAGVRAWVYACDGDCGDPSKHVVLYLEQYSPAYHRMREAGERIPPIETMQHTMVRAIDGTQWLSAIASDGRAVRERSKRCADGSGRRMRRCFPG